MYIGSYGTLMLGQQRHGALGTSTFLGRYRSGRFNTLLIQTPAGFPAFVTARGEYLRDISKASEGWWKQYKKDNPETVDSYERTGWKSGLDTPLMEVYDVTPATLSRLDIIEGVPHLYQRMPMHIAAVDEKTTSYVDLNKTFRRTLKATSKAFPEANRLDESIIDRLAPFHDAHIYYIKPDDDWIQGSEIIWNGDFNNPLIRDDIKYNYNVWFKDRHNKEKDIREVMGEPVEMDDLERLFRPARRRKRRAWDI